jgi:hypothetical protein
MIGATENLQHFEVSPDCGIRFDSALWNRINAPLMQVYPDLLSLGNKRREPAGIIYEEPARRDFSNRLAQRWQFLFSGKFVLERKVSLSRSTSSIFDADDFLKALVKFGLNVVNIASGLRGTRNIELNFAISGLKEKFISPEILGRKTRGLYQCDTLGQPARGNFIAVEARDRMVEALKAELFGFAKGVIGSFNSSPGVPAKLGTRLGIEVEDFDKLFFETLKTGLSTFGVLNGPSR